jgi:hypothetical protein
MASRTVTATEQRTTTAAAPGQPVVLRLSDPEPEKKVKWDDAVIDNEGMGKRSSKSTCRLGFAVKFTFNRFYLCRMLHIPQAAACW